MIAAMCIVGGITYYGMVGVSRPFAAAMALLCAAIVPILYT